MHKSINKPITALACAVALATALVPFANADLSRSKLSDSLLANPITPKQQSAAQCVTAIQQHWPREAKLVLDKRARQRETSTQKVLLVDGWVWEQGKRVQKHHECVTNKDTGQIALQVHNLEQALLARQ